MSDYPTTHSVPFQPGRLGGNPINTVLRLPTGVDLTLIDVLPKEHLYRWPLFISILTWAIPLKLAYIGPVLYRNPNKSLYFKDLYGLYLPFKQPRDISPQVPLLALLEFYLKFNRKVSTGVYGTIDSKIYQAMVARGRLPTLYLADTANVIKFILRHSTSNQEDDNLLVHLLPPMKLAGQAENCIWWGVADSSILPFYQHLDQDRIIGTTQELGQFIDDSQDTQISRGTLYGLTPPPAVNKLTLIATQQWHIPLLDMLTDLGTAASDLTLQLTAEYLEQTQAFRPRL